MLTNSFTPLFEVASSSKSIEEWSILRIASLSKYRRLKCFDDLFLIFNIEDSSVLKIFSLSKFLNSQVFLVLLSYMQYCNILICNKGYNHYFLYADVRNCSHLPKYQFKKGLPT